MADRSEHAPDDAPNLRPEQVAYLESVTIVLERYEAILGRNALSEARELIEHSEAPIGMGSLAWVLVKSGYAVSDAEVTEIRSLMTPDELPYLPERFKEGAEGTGQRE